MKCCILHLIENKRCFLEQANLRIACWRAKESKPLSPNQIETSTILLATRTATKEGWRNIPVLSDAQQVVLEASEQ